MRQILKKMEEMTLFVQPSTNSTNSQLVLKIKSEQIVSIEIPIKHTLTLAEMFPIRKQNGSFLVSDDPSDRTRSGDDHKFT